MGRCLIKGGYFPKTQRGKMNKHENILYVSGRKCLSLLNVLKLEFPGPDGLVMRPQKVSVIVRGPLKLHQQGWDDLIPQGFLTDSDSCVREPWPGRPGNLGWLQGSELSWLRMAGLQQGPGQPWITSQRFSWPRASACLQLWGSLLVLLIP